MHSNMCAVLRPWTWLKIAAYSLMPSLLPEDERQLMFPLSKFLEKAIRETGYLHEQATKPDTLGECVTPSCPFCFCFALQRAGERDRERESPCADIPVFRECGEIACENEAMIECISMSRALTASDLYILFEFMILKTFILNE